MKGVFSSRSLVSIAAIVVSLQLSSCGLLISKKRTLKNQVIVYQNHLSESNFDKAAKMCHRSKFTWINAQGEKTRGPSAITAFNNSIATISSKSGVQIQIDKITETKKNKVYVVAGFILVKQSDSTSLRSVKLFVAMTWATNGKEWRLMQVKETAKRKTAHS